MMLGWLPSTLSSRISRRVCLASHSSLANGLIRFIAILLPVTVSRANNYYYGDDDDDDDDDGSSSWCCCCGGGGGNEEEDDDDDDVPVQTSP